MAAGRPPSPDGTSRRRDEGRRLGGAVTTLPLTEGVVHGEPLPNAKTFSAATRKWFETWRRAPQAVQFTVTDWQRLHMLAPLVEAYFEKPTTQLMAEIRLNEERLGATPVDRLRLGYRITRAPSAGAAGRPGTALERARQAQVPSARDRLTVTWTGRDSADGVATEEAG